MPQGGNSETIIDQLGNVINNFMYGHKINIPKLILKKLDDLEVNKVGRVYLASSYVMFHNPLMHRLPCTS